MKKQFYKDIDWTKVRQRDFDSDDIPYKSNPNKYKYLLSNEYPFVSNLNGVIQTPTNVFTEGSTDKASDPNRTNSPQKKLLGDFTLYKVNREFYNF